MEAKWEEDLDWQRRGRRVLEDEKRRGNGEERSYYSGREERGRRGEEIGYEDRRGRGDENTMDVRSRREEGDDRKRREEGGDDRRRREERKKDWEGGDLDPRIMRQG